MYVCSEGLDAFRLFSEPLFLKSFTVHFPTIATVNVVRLSNITVQTVLGLRFVISAVQSGRHWKSRHDDGVVYAFEAEPCYDVVRYTHDTSTQVCCCCLHIKNRSDLYSVLSNIRTGPTDANAFRGHRLTTQKGYTL